MKKRMMSILLLATMVTGLIAGCGSTKKEAKAKKTEKKVDEKQEKINKLNCHARSYYFVITIRSVCIDYLRKNKIKSKYLDEYVTEEQVINTNMSEKRHINEFEKSEMYIDLSNALLKMSERDKELLTYRYTMEMSSKEISQITGIKESNVNSYIRRAREKLLKIFNGEV